MTLSAKNVSLTEWNNSDKEKVNDEVIKSTVHARIQARGGQTGPGRAKHCGGGQNIRSDRADAVQLGQGSAPGSALGC